MIRVGVIGCGRWGPNHIRVFGSLPDCEVVCAADQDEERLANVRRLFPHVRCVGTPHEVIADPRVDVAVVATPTATHYEIVRKALDAGKHVLCEKPLCETAAQAEELVNLARTRERVLLVGHVFLFNPGILKVKEIIDAHELGRVYYLSAVRVNLGPIRSDVNAAYDLAAHDVAIFNWLLNDTPETVSAAGTSYLQSGIEDVVFMTLRYPGNVLAHIQASWLDPKKVRQITVVGSERMLTWDDLQPSTPVAVYDKGAHVVQEYKDYQEFLRVSMWDGEVRLPRIVPQEPLMAQASSLLQSIRQGTVGRSDGAFGVGVVRVLEAAAQSIKQRGAPVALR